MNIWMKGLAATAFAACSTLASAETIVEARATLNAALAEISSKGLTGAATAFNGGGKWRGNKMYVVVADFNGNMLAHSDNQKIVGKNMLEAKDAAGKPFVRETISNVKGGAESVVELRWANPNTKKIDDIRMAARRVPGQDAYVGVVFFE